jgi:hypothetical protein
MLRSKYIPVFKIGLSLVLILSATLTTSQGSGTSPEINLIDFNISPLEQNNETMLYDIGNGSFCSIYAGSNSNCLKEITRLLKVVEGKDGKALQLIYGLDECSNSYAEVVFKFDPPQDLSAFDHLVMDWRGDKTANSLNVGINDTKNQSIAPLYRNVTQKSWWGPLVVPFKHIGSNLDLSRVERIFISVKNDSDITDYRNEGGAGSITIDGLRLLKIGERKIPSDFESVNPDLNASGTAAKWLASQQKDTGLLQSWMEERNSAHLYDQSLALIVFSREGMWGPANNLVKTLSELQNKDGSWNETYDCEDKSVISSKKWLGSIAWTVFALDQYQDLGGNLSEAKDSMELGADWLEERIKQSNDCLNEGPVEGLMDAWWALQAVGRTEMADKIKQCLMESYWDEEMGRFTAGKGDWRPVSDVQTWGAAFLRANGEKEKALRALSYAREALLVTSQDQKVTALGDQAGPWSVSNECTGQYIVAGGEGSNQFLQELVSQQRYDGAMPGSPDNFKGAGAWNTQWHGVAPTAWLYFASNKGPFNFDMAK